MKYPVMTMGKRLVFSGAAVLLAALMTLVLAEAMARGLRGDELEAYHQQMLAKRAKAQQVLANGVDNPLQTVFAYHPYYSYANSRRANLTPGNYYYVDQYGFRNDFDYRRPPAGVRQIGIFGGSAAFGWSVDNEHTLARCLERLLNQEQPQAWRVVNFGVGGWHLPQQLFVLLRELPFLDGAVFYDGVNELAFCVKDAMNSAFPPDFPLYGGHTFFPATGAENKNEKIWELFGAQASFPAESWLARSRLYLFFSRLRIERLETEADRLVRQKPRLPPEDSLEFRSPTKMSFGQAMDLALADYRRYALAADAIAEKAGKKMLHVLQPQMFAGLTPGQVAEKWGKSLEHVTSTYDPWYWEYHRLGSLFQQTWGDSKGGLGPLAQDLSTILPVDFDYQSWWTDPVHSRGGGNEVIARNMYAKMTASGWFPPQRELPALTVLDQNNRGTLAVELSCQSCLKDAEGHEQVTWLAGQKEVGRGPNASPTLPVGPNHVFVKVSRPDGREWFYRKEVLVRHNLAVLENFAASGRASSNDQNSRPQLAIDGHTGAKTLDEMWCSSAPSRQFYWELDLGRQRQVKAIEIFFREGYRDPGQVSNLRLWGSLEPRFAQAIPLASRGAGPFPADRRWVIYLPDQPLRYLRISRDDDNYLTLAEVRVLGERTETRP